MERRSVETIKQVATQYINDVAQAEENKRLASLVNLSLTREQVAFAMAATEDDMSDTDWRKLLHMAYSSGENYQAVADMAWEMTGFDGTDKDQETLQVYVDAYRNAHDGQFPNLYPNELWAVITDVDNQKECNTVEEWITCIEANEHEDEDEDDTKPVDPVTTHEAEVSAYKIADTLNKDDEFRGLMTKTADNAQFLKVAPILLMRRIEAHFGGDTIEGWPTPGSKHKDGLVKEGNQLFDKFKVAKGGGEKGTRTVSFYGIIFDRMEEGKEINRKLADLAKGEDGPYATNKATGWSIGQRAAEKKTLTQRRVNQLKYFGNAVRLHQQLAWLSKYPNCIWDYDKEVNGELRRTVTPFILAPKYDGKITLDSYKYAVAYAISDILRLDHDKAYAGWDGKKAGSWDSLVATLKRIQSDEDKIAALKAARELVAAADKAAGIPSISAQGTNVPTITKVEQLELYVSEVAAFAEKLFASDGKSDPNEKAFNALITTSDGFILSLNEIRKLISACTGRIDHRIAEINKKLAAKEQTDKAKTS